MSSTKIQVPLARVAIVGTGLIGGSFALALRKHFPAITVIGFDRPEVVHRALERGAIQQIACDLDEAVRDAELVYVALPIAGILEALPRIAERAKTGALVTDAGSTKVRNLPGGDESVCARCSFSGRTSDRRERISGIESAGSRIYLRGSRYALITEEADADPRVRAFAEILTALRLHRFGATRKRMTGRWASLLTCHNCWRCALASVMRDEIGR